jgi:hypothetical protein
MRWRLRKEEGAVHEVRRGVEGAVHEVEAEEGGGGSA